MVIANNGDKTTAKMLKTLLAKYDALDQKLRNMDDNVKAEINNIKINSSKGSLKVLQKEEVI